MNIQEIVIAGAGTMGYSMAQIFAKYHYSVIIYDLNEEALSNAKKHIQDNVSILLNEQELTSQQSQDLFNHLSYTTNKDCFKECDLVVESIIEDLKIKKSFYQDISQFVKDECILATNTSGISINELASAVYKPERFIGMHWFNPCHLVLLIEIIKGKETHDSIADAIYQLSLSIDKKPVIVNKDVLGFAANRIQFAVLREALYLVEQGVISKEGIDDVMKYGLGFRYACLGPLEVADFGGLDTFYHISDYLMKDLCDSHEITSELKEHYMKHEYGVKCQQGFYDYHNGKDVEAIKQRDENLIKIFHALYR
ncbi:MAG: 3-hydroxyacyl-CoA dehydrogenase family protein [Coprobacillus cateniformis]|uniref:3-hydroxyacyl-CoA dehydrogenase family protein n=1 Tax=Coprobacillus cateniformis TaxID=100884 RepID=UPI0039A012D4